jgi:hypothetical protein
LMYSVAPFGSSIGEYIGNHIPDSSFRITTCLHAFSETSSAMFMFTLVVLAMCSLTKVMALSKHGLPMFDSDFMEVGSHPVDVSKFELPFLLQTDERCKFMETLAAWSGLGQSDVTMYMFGDSVMRHQFLGVCFATGDPSEELYQATFVPGKLHTCKVPLPSGGTLTAAFMGKDDAAIHNPDLLDTMQKSVGSPPDVLYFGTALHYLHLMPFKTWSLYSNWLNYEGDLIEFLSHPAVQKVKKVVFMKAHSVCEEKYTGDWGKQVDNIRQDPMKSVGDCVEYVSKKLQQDPDVSGFGSFAEHDTSVQAAHCLSGFMTSDGAAKLNARAMHSIDVWNSNKALRSVDVVDAFKLTENKCEFTNTGDGRHFPKLIYKELSELLATLGPAGSSHPDYLQKYPCTGHPLHAGPA